VPRGNPLWSVPLSALTATQERPIFSATRRPPPRAVVAPPAEEVKAAPPPRPAEPERPPLALIGAVVGEGDSIAVFIDRTSQKMIRLRPGEAHAGWVLDSVLRREVTLRKADRTETIELKAADPPVQAGLPVQENASGFQGLPSRRRKAQALSIRTTLPSSRARRRRTANPTGSEPVRAGVPARPPSTMSLPADTPHRGLRGTSA
jgi:hypothetical protein